MDFSMDSVAEITTDEIRQEKPAALKLTIDVDDVVNYAILQNGGHIVRDICLKNTGEEDMDNLLIRVSSDSILIEAFEIGVQLIRAGEEIHFKDKQLAIHLNGDYLGALTERLTCSLRFCVLGGARKSVASEPVEITESTVDALKPVTESLKSMTDAIETVTDTSAATADTLNPAAEPLETTTATLEPETEPTEATTNTSGATSTPQELISEYKEITVLAYDQWPGLKYTPELLAAFSMPNHPAISGILRDAAECLETWTENPSLDGYQSGSKNRVKQMAAAAYVAIQKREIIYANPPSSFEEFGQRIRLVDTMLEQRMGTCMDMTLLYVACLEAMGLNPVMVLTHGHVFAGVWLVEDSFSDTIMDDPVHLEKRMSPGINELLVVECTAMNAGRTPDFDQAIKLAENSVADHHNFEFVIDVTRARSMGIRPLPIRVKTDYGYAVEHKEIEKENIAEAPTAMGVSFDLSNLGEKVQVTKQLQWERKLLDLSMRNMLINLRFTKAMVPLLADDVNVLEDALADGEEFTILPRPDNMSIQGDTITVEAMSNLGPFSEFIALESKHRKLHSLFNESDLTSSLTKIYRSAKTSMEENGASTLYLALGLLRWYEGKKTTEQSRYAPLILLPIDITRKSARKGYSMRMRDEDAQLNITLLEFLKQNYEIDILGLNPLPTDEHGLDLPKIFAIFRHSVMDIAGWDVVEVGFVGNFSFSQFVMWNDIHSHCDILEKNDIVRSLINGAVDWDCTIPESVDTDEAYLPITADSSQLRAINMAAGGVSFVLHGPPGTGKSQTITAMIANALTKGQTILFVAEKMAALEVVQKRLDALGIGDFCLELHSNKATKKAVLDQLKRVLEINIYGLHTTYDEKIEDVRKMRASLDEYVKRLHEQRSFGKSVRELIDLYEFVPDEGVELRFEKSFVRDLSQNDLDNHMRALSRLIAAGRGIGHPKGHPLETVGQTVYTQTLKMDLETVIEDYQKALDALDLSVKDLVEKLAIAVPVTTEEWEEIPTYANSVITAENIPGFLLTTDNLDREFDTPTVVLKEKTETEKKKALLLQTWNDTFLQMDMNTYRTKYDEANKKFLGKGKAFNNLIGEMQAFAKVPVVKEQIPVLLADVEVFQKQEQTVKDKVDALSYEWRKLFETYGTEEAFEEYKSFVKSQRTKVAEFAPKIRELEQSGKLGDCVETAKKVIADYDVLMEKEQALVDLLQLELKEDQDNLMESRKTLCNQLLTNASVIKDWIVYRQAEEQCKELGLAVVTQCYRNGLEHEKVLNVYQRSIYRAIIIAVIETEPVLNGFTGNGFNEQIVQFKQLDAEFMELTKDEMYFKLTHQLPSSYDSVQFSKELNILRRAISSNGRGMSIRSLFEQIPTILSRLCPCMLMSPISVAQFISAEREPFDIVIFDEASQLPTCKAVGVLARGKNAVIVGDPNQMPPTSFFAGNAVDEDNLDIEDLDSILDDCLALGMPSAHLQWHYRSKHESLIAFSNHEFYENSMLTFPSVNDREKKVRSIKVEGFFDRKKGRINEGEADAIVAEIKRRYKDPELKKQSIGVVTFNISQQVLIEEKLMAEYYKDHELDKWANDREERLFVKNLENVQGDERDVILFSVAFGPDEEEKLSLNFGPINKEGGWKRLNVAVSRARCEMMVFTIMTSDMIDLRRTKSKGVESLKNFLGYAESGRLQLAYNDAHQDRKQGILETICTTLDKAGYAFQKAVGKSKFKVDLAVINPLCPDEYILGIMLDGESYRQSANTKDREVAQINVLSGLKWNLHRIWTMDWWDNKQKEIDKLLAVLEEVKAKYEAEMLEKAKAAEEAAKAEAEQAAKVAEEAAKAAEEHAAKAAEESAALEEQKEAEEEDVEAAGPAAGQSIEDAEENAAKVAKEQAAGVTETSMPEKYAEQHRNEEDLINDNTVISPEDELDYEVQSYEEVHITVTPMSTADYVLKENLPTLVERLRRIIYIEAPISHERLIKRVLRSYDISRSSAATVEATELAMKKVPATMNKQNGVRFYWREDQNPATYAIYRNDADTEDRRQPEDICQQEIKNAICVTLQENGALGKEELIRETIHTMGFARTGTALAEAVERGLKYGRKSGEIEIDGKEFMVR